MNPSVYVLDFQISWTHSFQYFVPNVLTNIKVPEMPTPQCANSLRDHQADGTNFSPGGRKKKQL